MNSIKIKQIDGVGARIAQRHFVRVVTFVQRLTLARSVIFTGDTFARVKLCSLDFLFKFES